ncbi:MAG: hypothetical protein R3Y46_07165 [Opitutales bacterium]
MTEEEKIDIVIKKGYVPEYMIPEDCDIPYDMGVICEFDDGSEIECIDVFGIEAAESYYEEYLEKKLSSS